MADILLSIKPEFVEKIFLSEKNMNLGKLFQTEKLIKL